MSTPTEIEEAIAKLPPSEFRDFLDRLNEQDAPAWDREIEEEAENSKLKALYTRLMEEVLDDRKFS